MLKFILRVFVVAVISFAVAYQIVNRGLGYLVEPMVEDLAVRTMRGQVYALHKDLDPVAPADRATFLLQQVLPHYGLGCGCWRTPGPAHRERIPPDRHRRFPDARRLRDRRHAAARRAPAMAGSEAAGR